MANHSSAALGRIETQCYVVIVVIALMSATLGGFLWYAVEVDSHVEVKMGVDVDYLECPRRFNFESIDTGSVLCPALDEAQISLAFNNPCQGSCQMADLAGYWLEYCKLYMDGTFLARCVEFREEERRLAWRSRRRIHRGSARPGDLRVSDPSVPRRGRRRGRAVHAVAQGRPDAGRRCER